MSDGKNENATGLRDRLLSALLYLLPQQLISRLTFRLARAHSPLKKPVLRWFIRHYQVDMSEAVEPDIDRYGDFNSFFTRALKPELRPVDEANNAVISPVDGTVSQIGSFEQGMLLQAKGHYYTLHDLLGGQHCLTSQFTDGRFATLYLSPRDYHRIHMPIHGKLKTMIHIPGRLFSVAPHTTRTIPRLFARNERVVCCFENADTCFAMVLVGAINVSAIETVWHGLVRSNHRPVMAEYDYTDRNIELAKGQEMGRFNLGSTVILITSNRISWLPDMLEGTSLRYGQRLGTVNAFPEQHHADSPASVSEPQVTADN